MRILQACPYDWHAPGGVQTHVRELTHELQRRGHEVVVVAPGASPASEPYVHIVGRPVRVAFNGTVAPICPSPVAAWRVRRVARELRPDLVHAHEWFAPSVAFFAGLVTTVPLVTTFHANVDLTIGPALYRLGTWLLNGRVSAGIAVSDAAAHCLGPRVRVPFRIVPNGVARSMFLLNRARDATASPRPRVLFAHRLEPRKGFRVALAAFVRIADACPDAEFVVVGDGADRALADRLPGAVRARVRMRGVVSREALMAELAAATVFIAPALHGESFGVVLLEAMAAGVPIVASDVDGYRGLLFGGGAALVPPGDGEALGAAVTRVLRDPAIGRQMGDVGRVRAAAYAWDHVATAVEEVYRYALAPASSARASAAI